MPRTDNRLGRCGRGLTSPRRATHIGSAIRKRRLELKMTQAEVAEAALITKQSISYYENGRARRPRYPVTVRLAKALKCSPYDIDPELATLIPDELRTLVVEWPRLSQQQQRAVLRAIEGAL